MGHLVLNYGAQRVEVLSCVIHSENISLLFESDEIAEKTLHQNHTTAFLKLVVCFGFAF